jgi:hypothetical protein
MMRVFLTGSYKPPREFNWGVGVILLVLTMLLSIHGISAPVGSARDLGHHGRIEHGQGHAPRRRWWDRSVKIMMFPGT